MGPAFAAALVFLSSLTATAFASAIDSAPANPFLVKIDGTGAYSAALPDWPDFTLTSEAPTIVVNGVRQTLTALSAPQPFTGQDTLGSFKGQGLTFGLNGQPLMMASIFAYDSLPLVVFDSFFPQEIAVNGSYQDKDVVSTSFPSFQAPTSPSPSVGLMRFFGPFLDDGVWGPTIQPWGSENLMTEGSEGGPIAFFDQAANHSVWLSPFSSFMAASLAQDKETRALRGGFMGSLKSIPAGSSVSFGLWYGRSINAAATGWGAALLQKYGKSHVGRTFDFTATHLMYSTDHGAYFWYAEGGFNNSLDALLAINTEAQEKKIPYRSLLLDSWWYYKGIGDGVKLWSAMPQIFPGGNLGIRELKNQTGWAILAHNRYFSSDNVYAKQNGGDYQFYVDAPGSPAGGQMALPTEQRFWNDLLNNATREWGLSAYLQDWLFNSFLGVDLLTSDINAGRLWLEQMNAGLEQIGLPAQFCMPFPRHALQSVELSQITQVRPSDDHVPGDLNYHLQWRIGYSSIFAAALALAPSKDNFYSSNSVEPGGSNGNNTETSPSMQNALSCLTAGPVAVADGPGHANEAEIMRSCNEDGRLLHPSFPVVALDSEITARVNDGWPGPKGEIYATHTQIGSWVWAHVFAASTNGTYSVSRSEVAAVIGARIALRNGGYTAQAVAAVGDPRDIAWGTAADLGTVAYSLNTTTFDINANGSLVVQPLFDDNNPIVIPTVGETNFALWHTAPVFSNGWALLGEMSKYVPVSEYRVQSVAVMGTDLLVELMGKAGELVPLSFWEQATGKVVTLQCKLDAGGRAKAAMPYEICS